MIRLEQILFGYFKGRKQILLIYLITLFVALVSNFLPLKVLFVTIFMIASSIAFFLIRSKPGIIPIARFFFIISPGFIQFLLWVLFDGGIRIGFLANNYITESIVRQVAVLSTVASVSSVLGFYLKPFYINLRLTTQLINDRIVMLSFLFFILFGLIYAKTLGPSILETGVYADSGGEEVDRYKFGTLNVFYFYFFSLFYVNKNFILDKKQDLLNAYILIALLVVFFLALRGIRQDSLGLILAIISIYLAEKRITANKGLYSFVFFMFILSWLGAVLTSVIRSDFNLTEILLVFSNPLNLLFSLLALIISLSVLILKELVFLQKITIAIFILNDTSLYYIQNLKHVFLKIELVFQYLRDDL